MGTRGDASPQTSATWPEGVAQIFNLLYRRVALGGSSRTAGSLVLAEALRNAIPRYSIENLRYGYAMSGLNDHQLPSTLVVEC